MRKAKLSSYDLCCGAGGFSFGFMQAGITVLGGVDTDAQAIETARANMPRARWEVSTLEAFVQHIAEDPTHIAFKASTLLAGLPCQGFSDAGRRNSKDARNYLYRYLLDAVRILEPTHVVVENVRGIAAQKNRASLKGIVSGLEKLGYSVGIRFLNALEFGVPQRRRRVFVVAAKQGGPEFVFECVRPSGTVVTVRDAFKGLPSKRERPRLSHVFMHHSPATKKRLRSLRPGGPLSYRRLVPDQPASTLVAGHRAFPVHPSEPRAISVREGARIQGFPDSFLFRGSRTSQIQQVANAVPPPIAKAIASALQRSVSYQAKVRGPLYKRLVSKLEASNRSEQLARAFRSVQNKRGSMPWRLTRDPFKTLLSELLLQRTKAELVRPVWPQIAALVPSIKAAVALEVREVTRRIHVLGLHSRPLSIRKLGKTLLERWGTVPEHFDELNRLPGVGIYIASAVRVFAIKKKDFPVDANAFRFVDRYYGITTHRRKSEARQIRQAFLDASPRLATRRRLYNFLDFCALVCRPVSPVCGECSLRSSCHFARSVVRPRTQPLRSSSGLSSRTAA